MGKRLAKRDARPDVLLSSPAKRALATAQAIAKAIGFGLKDIMVDPRLYPGEDEELLDLIHELDGKLKRVMLIGHNPGLTELANRLSSEITHMPTCAIAELRFDTKSWANVGRTQVAKVVLDTPKRP